jgi:hypothetical protein
MSDSKTDCLERPSIRVQARQSPIGNLGVIKTADLPRGFILFSEAIHRLQMSMRSGLHRPIAVQLVKKRTPKARIGFGPWRQRAGEDLTMAACERKLEVYVALGKQENPVCTRIPPKVLQQLMLVRGSLPDRAIRPSLKACGCDRILLLLQRGCLVVKESEFIRWLKAERRKGKWPSQQSRRKPRIGRPSKQSSDLRHAIIARIRDGVWSREQPITELRRELIASGMDPVPSADTLGRMIDNLYDETGDPDFLRSRRAPRRRSK